MNHILPKKLSFEDIKGVIFGKDRISLGEDCKKKLNETSDFIHEMVKQNVKIYGVTTGFASFKDTVVDSSHSKLLSLNIIRSHDAGIGQPLHSNITLCGMLLRANSLAQNHSGFTVNSLETLIGMINNRIIPSIPESGSLGASGDLAYLARLGRSMIGDDVPVICNGVYMSAQNALKLHNISPMIPQAKEGLALTNGTSFSTAMAILNLFEEIKRCNQLLSSMCLFMNCIGACDSAFCDCAQKVRGHIGQTAIAKYILDHLKIKDSKGVQNNYCIRCVPQIFGYIYEAIDNEKSKLIIEMNAVTDNPLIFSGNDVGNDVPEEKIHKFHGKKWAVLSCGNFHAEYISQLADNIKRANVKIILTMERQINYIMNPHRHQLNIKSEIFAEDLVPDGSKCGLESGFMIVQYTAACLAQKISVVSSPSSIFNITSGNESEDVVSFAPTSCLKWTEQLNYMKDFNIVYLTTMMQCYGLLKQRNGILLDEYEEVYNIVSKLLPTSHDVGFDTIYKKVKCILNKLKIGCF